MTGGGKYAWAIWLAGCASFAQATPLPYAGQQQHLGVASCASSMCHGAAGARADGNIQHNEYLTWQRLDRHARAYDTLLTSRSREIAAQLGIDAAERTELCLHCHTDYVPEPRRGAEFQLTDGISCEACHGGAENWLASHTAPDATHARNLAAGMYPTEDPAARAVLCQSCHLGHPDKPMLHRLLGAGHPPLQFELDTYMANLPPHHRVDDDYRARKPAYSPLDWWAQGQLVAARATLRNLRLYGIADLSRDGFPEFALYECDSCHHAIKPGRAPRSSSGLPRLGDVHLRMVGLLLAVDDPKAATVWFAELDALQMPTRRVVARTSLADRLAATRATLPDTWSEQRIRRLHEVLLDAGITGRLNDFDAARQLVMALAMISADTRTTDGGTASLAPLYDAVSERGAYSPEQIGRAHV